MPGTRPAIRDHHDHVIVTLCGELDIADAACLRDALTGAVTQNPHVVADLSGLDFVDCAVLGVLVRARGQALEAGGDLMLAGAGGKPGGFSSCRSWRTCSPFTQPWTRQ